MRQHLDNRRPAVTVKVKWTATGGPDHTLLVSYGFDSEPGRGGVIKEAFVASFRAESGFVALANDACKLYSRLLQHGDTLQELADTMGENRAEGAASGPPASMMGAIARKAVEVQKLYEKPE